MIKPYTCFQSQNHVKQNVSEHAYCLRSCGVNSTLNSSLCQATVTLHQGQGRGNEHGHIRYVYVYRHAKFECHSLNIVRYITIKLQVTTLSSLCRSCGLELRSRSSDKH